jgi:hypothetical protein
MDRSYYCFVMGCIELFKPNPDHGLALSLMGNAYDAFVCGHEAHCYFIRAAVSHFKAPDTGVSMPNPWGAGWTRTIAEAIPRRLFFYWDKNPPSEVRDNFDHHASIREITVDTYSMQRAEACLRQAPTSGRTGGFFPAASGLRLWRLLPRRRSQDRLPGTLPGTDVVISSGDVLHD